MPYINTQTNQYPVTERDIRNAYPNTSFTAPFKAPDEYALVFAAPQPAYDQLTQAVREIAPVLTNKGNYEQAWEVVPRFTEYTDDQGVVHTVAEQIAAAIEADRKSKVPQVVSMRQARLALLEAALLDDITTAITKLGQAAAIEWEYATEVRRDSPLIALVAANNSMQETDIDNLFILAASK